VTVTTESGVSTRVISVPASWRVRELLNRSPPQARAASSATRTSSSAEPLIDRASVIVRDPPGTFEGD
jgi:hypothetical protein